MSESRNKSTGRPADESASTRTPRTAESGVIAAQRSVSDALAHHLWELGVRRAFGLSGGAIARFMESLQRVGVEVYHCRHEGGAAFMAAEYSLAAQEPALVYTTTGPGLTNALTGLHAAKSEGARVVLVSGSSPLDRRSRFPFQSTDSKAFENPAFHDLTLDRPDQLEHVCRQLAPIRDPRRAHVARVFLSLSTQEQPAPFLPKARSKRIGDLVPLADFKLAATVLNQDHVVIWAGWGAQQSAQEVRELAERRRWPVMVTPRGKGVMDETHPLFLGVTGLGGHASVLEHLTRHRPRQCLVLGTRMSEFSSLWQEAFIPSEAFVHVDLDPTVFGRSFPDVPTLGVAADISTFLASMSDLLPDGVGNADNAVGPPAGISSARSDRSGELHPAEVFEAIQRGIVDQHPDAVVLTEAGNAFAWGSRLRFRHAKRYRTSTGFGSMGQATAGVVGAALANRTKAVAIVGDGAMIMNGAEVSTAVAYGADAVWIVLNDAKYGMVHHGMCAIGMAPIETEIPRADFVACGRYLGSPAVRASTRRELDEALAQAMRTPGPFIIDVMIDGSHPPPFGARNQNLTDALETDS